jgi:hypothetical protein
MLSTARFTIYSERQMDLSPSIDISPIHRPRTACYFSNLALPNSDSFGGFPRRRAQFRAQLRALAQSSFHGLQSSVLAASASAPGDLPYPGQTTMSASRRSKVFSTNASKATIGRAAGASLPPPGRTAHRASQTWAYAIPTHTEVSKIIFDYLNR